MSGMHAQGGLPIPDITHIDQPHWYAEGGDMTPDDFGLERARQLEAKIQELGEDRVAAFIAEPIQGAGGVIIPPDSYWPEIQRICDKYEILLIADEVITGFGRTGNWFGSQTMGIRPDIMTIAKGVTSGYLPTWADPSCRTRWQRSSTRPSSIMATPIPATRSAPRSRWKTCVSSPKSG